MGPAMFYENILYYRVRAAERCCVVQGKIFPGALNDVCRDLTPKMGIQAPKPERLVTAQFLDVKLAPCKIGSTV